MITGFSMQKSIGNEEHDKQRFVTIFQIQYSSRDKCNHVRFYGFGGYGAA